LHGRVRYRLAPRARLALRLPVGRSAPEASLYLKLGRIQLGAAIVRERLSHAQVRGGAVI